MTERILCLKCDAMAINNEDGTVNTVIHEDECPTPEGIEQKRINDKWDPIFSQLFSLLSEEEIMFNNKMYDWNFYGSDTWENPKCNREVFILVEPDVIYEEIPQVVKSMLEIEFSPTQEKVLYKWKLLEYDPETQEEYLQQNYSVIAWRYV